MTEKPAKSSLQNWLLKKPEYFDATCYFYVNLFKKKNLSIAEKNSGTNQSEQTF